MVWYSLSQIEFNGHEFLENENVTGQGYERML